MNSLFNSQSGISSSFGSFASAVANHRDSPEKGAWWNALERWALFVLILLAPIFFLPATPDPVGLNKQLFVGIIVAGVFVAVLARLIDRGALALPPRRALIAASALLGAVILSTMFSSARPQSFLATAPDSLIWVAMYVVAFIVASTTLTTRASLRIAAYLFLASSGLLTVFGLLQASGKFIFPHAFTQAVTFTPMGSITSLGFVASAALAALVAFIATPSRPRLSGLTAGATGALAVTFFLLVAQINAPSIWIALAVSMAAIAALVGYQAVRAGESTMRSLLLPFLLLVISVFAITVQPSIDGFISVGIDVRPSMGASWDIAQSTLAGKDALWGNGPSTFPYAYSEHRPQDINQTDFWGVQFNQGFSAVLTYLVSWGILGIFSLLAVFIVFFLTVFRGLSSPAISKEPGIHAIALGAFSVMLVLGSSFFLYQGNTVTHLLFFLASGIAMSALIVGGALEGLRVHAAGSPRVLVASSLIAIILMSVALGSLYFMVERYRGQLALSSAVATFQESEDLVATVEKLNTALQIDETNDAVLRTASQAMVLRLAEVLQDTEVEPDVARDQFTAALQNAVTTARRATEVAPWNVQNWLQLASVYEQTIGLVDGVEQLAADTYEEVQKRDPSNPSIPLAQGRVFMAAADTIESRLNIPVGQQEESQLTTEQRQELVKKREEYLAKARTYLEESISLKENYAAGRFLLAQILDRQGDIGSAVGETRRVVAANPQDAGALLQLGILDIKAENYEEARAALERAKLLVEDYANARYFLGIAYARLDQRNAAIAEFEWLREKNPENQLVQQVLTNLREGRDPLAAPAEEPESAPPVEETGGAQQQPLQ